MNTAYAPLEDFVRCCALMSTEKNKRYSRRSRHVDLVKINPVLFTRYFHFLFAFERSNQSLSSDLI
jgi:hypothetical protein